VHGGGFIQGYNCQDAAADDRLMLGGYACQDTGDVLQAQALAAVAEKGAAVVAAAHAAHAADPAMLAKCHGRLCTLPERGKHDPGHDIAACHATLTGGIGVLVEDAGYHSEANLTARPARPGSSPTARPAALPAASPPQDPRPPMPRPWRPTHTGCAPPTAAPPASAAPSTSRACTPASKTNAACAASASAACTTPPASSSSPASPATSRCWQPSAENSTRRPAALRAAVPQHAR
jgi:hypothetical protein